jgi:hypothetical protein
MSLTAFLFINLLHIRVLAMFVVTSVPLKFIVSVRHIVAHLIGTHGGTSWSKNNMAFSIEFASLIAS